MIYLGADHGGFQIKEALKGWLDEWKLSYTDLGPKTLDPEDDYPVYGLAVAGQVGGTDDTKLPWGQRPKGILICRSAAGMVIAANKVNNVKAVAAMDVKSAQHAREHNDANVLGLSGEWVTSDQANDIIHTWLTTEFSGEARHARRLDQIRAYEQR